MHDLFVRYSVVLKAVSVVVVLLAGCNAGIDRRIERAYALARNPTEPNKNRIEQLAKDEDRDVRATALVVMGTIDAQRARRMALAAITDPDGFVRAAAVPLVSGPDAIDPETTILLTSRATEDPVWQVRARALEALASSDDPAVREAFIRALSDSVRQVRRTALRAGIGQPGLLPVDLLSALVVADPDWENRVEAAAALGASKDPAAFAGLDTALHDPNEFVRTAAARERRELSRAGVTPPPPPPEPPKAGVTQTPKSGV